MYSHLVFSAFQAASLFRASQIFEEVVGGADRKDYYSWLALPLIRVLVGLPFVIGRLTRLRSTVI